MGGDGEYGGPGGPGGSGGYWDPLPTARRLLAGEPSLNCFDGEWEERNWRNVPGPFYGAGTDSLQVGRLDAPFHLAYDDSLGPLHGREFVYRQPVDPEQVGDLLEGCAFGGYAMDGDDHWTVPAVRAWWQERGRVREWAVTTSHRWSRVRGQYREHYRDAAQGLRDYIAHLDDGLEDYLRGYLFRLGEGRPSGAGESLPLLEPSRPRPRSGTTAAATATAATATAPPARADDGAPLLAGYFVAVPESLVGESLPRTERLTTASDCLIDRLPLDGCWFDTAEEARTACAGVQVPDAARLYALMVPGRHVAGFVSDIRAAATYEPVLLDALDGPAGGGRPDGGVADGAVAEGGSGIGWEVLGYDHGLLHSWLCNGLYRDGVRELGVDIDGRGLLSGQDVAERVAAWANARDDTKPVTWFPALLVEWDARIESRFVPIVPSTGGSDRCPPQPWYRRLVGRGGRGGWGGSGGSG